MSKSQALKKSRDGQKQYQLSHLTKTQRNSDLKKIVLASRSFFMNFKLKIVNVWSTTKCHHIINDVYKSL
jgi:hypothetical protein